MKNMIFKRRLPIPKEIKEMFPVSEQGAQAKSEHDAQLRDVITGVSDKMLLVVGPCSADREDAVIDYITRLSSVRERVKDRRRRYVRTSLNRLERVVAAVFGRTIGDGNKIC